MADIEEIYRCIIQSVNEQRWEDLPRYMSSHLIRNGQDYTPESYAAEIKLFGGGGASVELTVDALIVDQESQRLAATVLVKALVRTEKANANGETAQNISFTEQQFIWFEDGKVSTLFTLADGDEIRRQLSDPEYRYTPDLISLQAPPSQLVAVAKLSAGELEETYRRYIGCINKQTMETDLHRFCHPQAIHNTKTLTRDQYRLLIQEARTAVPDIVFGPRTVIVDERSQLVAARLEFTGTPVGIMAGAKPNGRGVSFSEHVTYLFEEGKIARVWSIVDWESYRRQLSD
ncbi:SnoaL-domain-containing protein [Annulohypoxylon maeteangense]|uniref:SnoaL-domain-containing protein n=1 Tax=Annulohypoxylon maeteangense TaxID=1927788 RepID=UPI002008D1C1|nr:SnoaL-domain-containing protein [Annulohypoxylon maeteangense]KAI0883494.1 SnoaL-domain-containing protein [Annulohypoxylon maeteangense]